MTTWPDTHGPTKSCPEASRMLSGLWSHPEHAGPPKTIQRCLKTVQHHPEPLRGVCRPVVQNCMKTSGGRPAPPKPPSAIQRWQKAIQLRQKKFLTCVIHVHFFTLCCYRICIFYIISLLGITASIGIGTRYRYRSRLKVSVSEVSVNCGIGLNLVSSKYCSYSFLCGRYKVIRVF